MIIVAPRNTAVTLTKKVLSNILLSECIARVQKIPDLLIRREEGTFTVNQERYLQTMLGEVFEFK